MLAAVALPSWQLRQSRMPPTSRSLPPVATMLLGRTSTYFAPSPNPIEWPYSGLASWPNNEWAPGSPAPPCRAPSEPLCGAWQPAQPRPWLLWAPRTSTPGDDQFCAIINPANAKTNITTNIALFIKFKTSLDVCSVFRTLRGLGRGLRFAPGHSSQPPLVLEVLQLAVRIRPAPSLPQDSP